MTHTTWDAIIIGGGAAGLSAAQTLGRSLRRTLVLDAAEPRNRFADHMHNVLGFDGVPPGELLTLGRAQAAAYGVEFRSARVTRVSEHEGEPGVELRLELDDGTIAATRSVIVASGVRDELAPIPGLVEHWGSGVLHCPYCHGWEVRGSRIGVIPTAPSGMHLAKILRQWTGDLTVFAHGLGALTVEERAQIGSRGTRLVDAPVAEVLGAAGAVVAVRTADGKEYPIDAVFTTPRQTPRDAFLAGLELARADTPHGAFLAVDPMQRTSHLRIWAVGNVVAPAATVPMAMAAGTQAGISVNAALVEEDFARVAADAAGDPEADPAPGRAGGHEAAPAADPVAFWEDLYAGGARWSGRVNASLAAAVADLPPGRSLDLGCGEGGDVLWLAERGWRATGIDLSATAVARGEATARGRGIDPERVSFIAGDLGAWASDPAALDRSPVPFDLITASFLQSPVELPRASILRAAARRLAPGGTLVLVSHAAPPPWAPDHPGEFPTPAGELAALELDASEWDVLDASVRTREATAPDGGPALLEDTVVIARRR